jgi:uncharacterized membrane protein
MKPGSSAPFVLDDAAILSAGSATTGARFTDGTGTTHREPERKSDWPSKETIMRTSAHLWAIGYEEIDKAGQVRDEIARLAWGPGQGGKYLILLDAPVVVRHLDGSFTLNREPFPGIENILNSSAVGFLAGLAVAAPLTGATIGAFVGGAGTLAYASQAGISADFIQEIEQMMKPGTSALFVLDEEEDMDVTLHTIRGLGGKVLKTNVDLERAKLIQSTLADRPT